MIKITPAPFPKVFEDKLEKKGLAVDYLDVASRFFSNNRSRELKIKPINGNFDVEHLAKIHKHLFQDVSTHAGVIRGYSLSKDGNKFAGKEGIKEFEKVLNEAIPERLKALKNSIDHPIKYIEETTKFHTILDYAHPFREGNGRATRQFMSQIALSHGYVHDFSSFNQDTWVQACKEAINGDLLKKQEIFQVALQPSLSVITTFKEPGIT